MGCFNATCIISNLPIEDGTKVRFLALAQSAINAPNDHSCYVGGRWQLHGVPLKARYNDYGSVNKIQDSFTTRMFFEGLKRGVVEKGVGENQCHDVEVRAEMSPNKWLEALWEGRVEVLDYGRPTEGKEWTPSEPPEGVPSLRRIEKLMNDAGRPVVTDYGVEGYILDQVSIGFIRIRCSGYEKQKTDGMQDIPPILHAAGYAAMVTMGTGSYGRQSVEVLVAPLPQKGVHIHATGLAPDRHMRLFEPRPVSQAMIREDVWQILLSTPVDVRFNEYTVEKMRESALTALEEDNAFKASLNKPELSADDRLDLVCRRDLAIESSQNLFLDCIRGHEGASGYTLRAAYRLAQTLAQNPEELRAYLIDMADTVYVQEVYSGLYGQWHPSTNNSQEGFWDEHRAFRLKLAEIKGQYEDDDSDYEAPEEDDGPTLTEEDDD